MSRRLEAAVPLAGDADALHRRFHGDPADWLPDMARPGTLPDRWQVYLWGGEVGMLTEVVLGEAMTLGPDTWRLVRWEPVDIGRMLQAPSFEGDLGVRTGTDGRVRLHLRGAYRPPGRELGWIADRLLLHRVARSTARRFLEEIAARLDQPQGSLR
jgi:hypothetical protein